MRHALVALLTALLAACVCATPAAGASKYRECRQVNFTPQSDDLAGDIKVRNVSCRYARAFIRETNGSPPEGHRRWRCTGRLVDDEGLQHTRYRCVRGAQIMRWSRF